MGASLPQASRHRTCRRMLRSIRRSAQRDGAKRLLMSAGDGIDKPEVDLWASRENTSDSVFVLVRRPWLPRRHNAC